MDKILCERYPKIFVNRNADMKKTAMCWGFECGPGWYTILDKLCYLIQQHVDREIFGLGNGLVEQVVATQVKEKYGTLRFYVGGADDYIYDLIDKAEVLSAYTCDVCGEVGRMRGNSWFMVRCDEHADS